MHGEGGETMPVSTGKIMWQPPVAPALPQPRVAAQRPADVSFSEILKQELKEPNISLTSHALDRLRQRQIFLRQDTMLRLSDAVDRAQDKGAREALVLDSDLAYVVSVKNRAVITVMDRSQMRDHVFTQIDSAVIL